MENKIIVDPDGVSGSDFGMEICVEIAFYSNDQNYMAKRHIFVPSNFQLHVMRNEGQYSGLYLNFPMDEYEIVRGSFDQRIFLIA